MGKLLIEAQGGEDRAKYGDELIKDFSKILINEVGKKYNYKTLLKIRKFYLFSEKVATLSRQLTWSHYVELLPLKDVNEINYYINITEEYRLGVRELREKIKNREYQRLDDKTKLKLISKEEITVSDFIKNPIIIKNKNNINEEEILEKVLQNLILEDIPCFLKELGTGFSFIENEYKIKIGENYNYIDLLLFNYIYNCFVVIELKVTELKKEHIGQIEIYMNYIDKHIKNINQNKTIGVIVTRRDNHYYIKYSSDSRILTREYVLNKK